MKTCFRCSATKPLGDFYTHPRMADGHLNKCKECTKSDTAERYNRLILDPVWREREYDRHRAKWRRARDAGKIPKIPQALKREVMRRHRHKHVVATRARQKVARSIRSGELTRLPCEICGKRAHAHHPDHSQALNVRWLCPQHHAEADNELRRIRRAQRDTLKLT